MYHYNNGFAADAEVISDLRAALAEPQQSPEDAGYVPLSADGRRVFIDGVGEVPLDFGALAEPEQEPVAWGLFAKIKDGEFQLQHPVRFSEADAENDLSMYERDTVIEIRRLYDHTPARRPLTTVQEAAPELLEALQFAPQSPKPQEARMSDDLTWLEFRCETLRVENEELRAKIAVLKAECDALRADAERYRWLRSDVATAENYPIACMRDGGWLLLGDELDAAIDAVREAGK